MYDNNILKRLGTLLTPLDGVNERKKVLVQPKNTGRQTFLNCAQRKRNDNFSEFFGEAELGHSGGPENINCGHDDVNYYANSSPHHHQDILNDDGNNIELEQLGSDKNTNQDGGDEFEIENHNVHVDNENAVIARTALTRREPVRKRFLLFSSCRYGACLSHNFVVCTQDQVCRALIRRDSLIK